MVTVIRLKRKGNTLYIPSAKSYEYFKDETVLTVAHKIANSDCFSGIYCIFFGTLADIDARYRNETVSGVSMAEFLYSACDVKVEK